MFDINGDGNLDGFERAMQMDFIDYFNHDGIFKESLSYYPCRQRGDQIEFE